jgi:hypothetical protein
MNKLSMEGASSREHFTRQQTTLGQTGLVFRLGDHIRVLALLVLVSPQPRWQPFPGHRQILDAEHVTTFIRLKLTTVEARKPGEAFPRALPTFKMEVGEALIFRRLTAHCLCRQNASTPAPGPHKPQPLCYL